MAYAKRFFNEVVKSLTRVPRMTLLGILGVILIYVSATAIISSTTPWLVRGDTKQHIDHIWRVHKGELPKWYDGLQYPPFVKIFGNKPHSSSANPPLYFVLQAPILGPLLDRGEWQKAIFVGRLINIFQGVLCIMALSWAAWLYGGSKRHIFAIITPALAVLVPRFARLNYDFAIDAQLIFLATLSFILNYKIIYQGPLKKYMVYSLLLAILGMLTKAPYLVFLLVNLLAIVIGSVLNGKAGNRKKDILWGLRISALIFGITIVATGWFYYLWNFKTNGNLFSSSPASFTGGRPYKSLAKVITSQQLRDLFYKNFAALPALSIAMTTLVITWAMSLGDKKIKRLMQYKKRLLVHSLVSLAFIGMLFVQIKFAIGYGAINFRYLLPAIFPIALVLSYGLSQWRWVRGQLAAGIITVMAVSDILTLAGKSFHSIVGQISKNSLPTYLPIPLFLMLGAGVIVMSVALFNVSKPGFKS